MTHRSKSKAGKRPAPRDVLANTNEADPLCGLSVRAARFIDTYLLTFNAGQAYREAGYVAKNENTARVCAHQLLIRPNVRAYIARRTKAMFQALAEQQEVLMRTLTLIAYADPRELVEHVRGACRYCHGKFNRWQYTAGEWDGATTRYVERQEWVAENDKPAPREPDPKGGTGYNLNADPNPECPECGGDGIGRTLVKDTRHLSPAARALYAGVKEGKDGIEVKMHDQMKALDMLAKIFKLYEESTTASVTVPAVEELEALYEKALRVSHERMAKIRADRLRLRQEREGDGGAAMTRVRMAHVHPLRQP